ncbi:hypothetical protein [Chitinophaga japonensis]|uniref:Uncharacterized protein n=1 Tax=Chitinophaga japonensis TaxID=104662 RepID=A0A562SZA8_CHIJA|nr:hypothetical protein [Chitinophaga japonensis]TWI86344.1 hypothetical protein LX66_3598 [Chitinophaga japonensis]
MRGLDGNTQQTYIKIFKAFCQDQDSSKNKENIENAIMEMKKAGASPIDCTSAIVMGLKLPLSEADALVINSPAWRKEREGINKFRDEMDSFFDNK